jgi:hypothetical protein
MEQAMKMYTAEQQDFVDYIMELYVRNGFKELGSDKLPTLIQMKYHSPHDAVNKLKMQPQQIRDFYLHMQQQLYNGKGVTNLTIENHFHGSVGMVYNKE